MHVKFILSLVDQPHAYKLIQYDIALDLVNALEM